MCTVSVIHISRCSLHIVKWEVGTAVDSFAGSVFAPRYLDDSNTYLQFGTMTTFPFGLYTVACPARECTMPMSCYPSPDLEFRDVAVLTH